MPSIRVKTSVSKYNLHKPDTDGIQVRDDVPYINKSVNHFAVM